MYELIINNIKANLTDPTHPTRLETVEGQVTFVCALFPEKMNVKPMFYTYARETSWLNSFRLCIFAHAFKFGYSFAAFQPPNFIHRRRSSSSSSSQF